MTYLQAAIEVLRGAERPLSASEIAERATARGLIHPGGSTPAATMGARLYSYSKECTRPEIVRVRVPGVRGRSASAWKSAAPQQAT